MFFLLPVGVDYRTDRLPIVTFSIIGLCTLLYVLGVSLFLSQVGNDETLRDPLIDRYGLVPNRTTLMTWFSHMFLHAGLFHLLGNMAFLFLFGSVVEDMIGRAKFLAFFLVGGLSAAAIHVLFTPSASGNIPMVGASGAISACIGSFVVLQTATHVHFRYFFWIIVPVVNGEFTLPSWVVISFWFLRDVFGFIADSLAPNAGGGAAFGAHIGGMITGVIIALSARAVKRVRFSFSGTESPQATRRQNPQTYIHHQGQQSGPYSHDQVAAFVKDHVFDRDAVYWEDGMPDWQPLRNFRSN